MDKASFKGPLHKKDLSWNLAYLEPQSHYRYYHTLLFSWLRMKHPTCLGYHLRPWDKEKKSHIETCAGRKEGPLGHKLMHEDFHFWAFEAPYWCQKLLFFQSVPLPLSNLVFFCKSKRNSHRNKPSFWEEFSHNFSVCYSALDNL